MANRSSGTDPPKRGRGRPPRGEAASSTWLPAVRVTEEELARWRTAWQVALAKIPGLSFGDWIRIALDGAASEQGV